MYDIVNKIIYKLFPKINSCISCILILSDTFFLVKTHQRPSLSSYWSLAALTSCHLLAKSEPLSICYAHILVPSLSLVVHLIAPAQLTDVTVGDQVCTPHFSVAQFLQRTKLTYIFWSILIHCYTYHITLYKQDT